MSARRIQQVRDALRRAPRRWVVTGAAGFIGSHLVEQLLRLDQHVVGVDDFSTGQRGNLVEVLEGLSREQASRFRLLDGDVRDAAACARACNGAELVLHEAALGSVPRSIDDPVRSHEVNVTGFLRVLQASRAAGVRRVVYASSSSVYGDHPALPKIEERVGAQLSPYAVTKYAGELYARVFGRCYGLRLVGLRYFNVFGPRQDPDGPYAAVVPRWFAALRDGAPAYLYGDGVTSRDFCFVENVVHANLLAATAEGRDVDGHAYNVACGERTSLFELFALIRGEVAARRPGTADRPVRREARPGDVRHSLADISRARRALGYEPAISVREGIARAASWYLDRVPRSDSAAVTP